jgi:hypothetical protein
MAEYERALQQLYQTPLADFVAQRKHLTAKLRAAGDTAAATRLAKSRRPTLSAWIVNQLYWHARDAFDDMLAAAARLRKGDVGAAGEYREALARLRQRATVMLKNAGHGMTDATVRRAAGTLAAIAAEGGFDEQPGTLAVDRDPPGFEVIGSPAKSIAPETRALPKDTAPATDERGNARVRAAAERQRIAAHKAERRAVEQAEKKRQRELARRTSERRRLETALRAARADVTTRERALSSLQKELRAAETAVGDARQVVQDVERKLADLDDPT